MLHISATAPASGAYSREWLSKSRQLLMPGPKGLEPKQVVWHKALTSGHTAPFSAAFVAATRLRLAMEGAARMNIEQAIQEISQLRLE